MELAVHVYERTCLDVYATISISQEANFYQQSFSPCPISQHLILIVVRLGNMND